MATLAVWFIVGVVLLVVLLATISSAGAPGIATFGVWLALSVIAVLLAVTAKRPAMRHDPELDWTDYCMRCVFVGVDEPHPVLVRILFAVMLGAPMVVAGFVYGLVSLVGSIGL